MRCNWDMRKSNQAWDITETWGTVKPQASPMFSIKKSSVYAASIRAVLVQSSWNVMAHGDAGEGKWRGNWRMQCVASTLHSNSEHGVSTITTADAHTSAASSRLNWRPLADLNAFVRFAERLNLVSARVPSHFNWPLPVNNPWSLNT